MHLPDWWQHVYMLRNLIMLDKHPVLAVNVPIYFLYDRLNKL